MKRILPVRALFTTLAFAALLLAACSETGEAPETEPSTAAAPQAVALEPQFTLDEAHNALWQDSALPFLTRPVPQFRLKLGDYAFAIPSELNRPEMLQNFGRTEPVTGPNVVHVLYNDNLYRVPWELEDGELVINATALGDGQKGKPFGNFTAKSKVFMMIGHEGPLAVEAEEAPFAPFYALRILVDENPLRFMKQPGRVQPMP
ncbi:MAG: hypothetical protein AAGN35_19530 [Bacteroidota bacterium]